MVITKEEKRHLEQKIKTEKESKENLDDSETVCVPELSELILWVLSRF